LPGWRVCRWRRQRPRTRWRSVMPKRARTTASSR
jgi:hypothetical protein